MQDPAVDNLNAYVGSSGGGGGGAALNSGKMNIALKPLEGAQDQRRTR